MGEKQQVYEFLHKHSIGYERYKHDAVYTVEQAKALSIDIEGTHCKNLLLRNRKGNRYYLVILEENEEADLTELREVLGETNLSFASPERLYSCLKVEPGSVGAFGLINDTDNKAAVVLGRALPVNQQISFHPNVNDETLAISYEDFEKMLKVLQKRVVQL